MKKLMFVAALAASAAAFADPINATAFANPAEYNPNTANSYFYFAGESDSSVVTNTSPSTTKHTANFATAEDANYLALDTEGSTLWRSLNTINSASVDETTTYSLGVTTNVAENGTYLDTLVQFTVTEDDAPTVGEGDKLAIWLQADETTGKTNLMVRARHWYMNGDEPESEATNFVASGVSIQPGSWYRLTVKAIRTATSSYYTIPAFQIFIDNNPVAAEIPQFATDVQSGLQQAWASGMGDLAARNQLFPSLVGTLASGTTATLQGVGFQGTGAIDEIVWTEENPIQAATVAFTLTWDANVTAVSYTIDGTTTTVADLTSGTTSVDVAPGTVVTVAATPAAWYTVSAGTGDVTVADTMTQAITTALAASPAAAGATGLPASVSTADAKAWADAKSLTPAQIAACTFAEKAYLLNTDLTVEPTFAITAIEEVTGGWKITVEAKSGNNTVDLEEIRGTLKVKTGATLEALGSATSEAILSANLTFDADGKAEITITGEGKNFIKATVE